MYFALIQRARFLAFAFPVAIPEEPGAELNAGSAFVCSSCIYFLRFLPKNRLSSPKYT
jgi:hypothetical protein